MRERTIDEKREWLNKAYPPTRFGICPFCGVEFLMKRHGGFNRFGFKTEVYYTEVGEHECKWTPPPPKEKPEVRKKRDRTPRGTRRLF
jgi:hypothetical protein